jgi:hypothetical protein
MNARTKRITKGTNTITERKSDDLPTGTMPRIFSPALIQIIARHSGILYASMPGKKNDKYSTNNTG